MNYKLTDMAMNIMELCKGMSFQWKERAEMAMCASCQCYVLNDVPLPEMGKMKKRCSQKHFMSNQTD
jgi:ferredoxin